MLPCLFLAVTIIAAEQLRSFSPKNKTTILQISHDYLVFSPVTNNNKWQIYIECKLCVSTWHATLQESQSDPARTHRHRRPPSCMIVTAMIVTVSPTRLGYDWREPLHEHGATIETKHLNSCSHKTTFELSLIITVVKIKLSFRFTKRRRLTCLAARDPLWREKSAWH